MLRFISLSILFLQLLCFSIFGHGIRGGEEVGHGVVLLNQQPQVQQGLVQLISLQTDKQHYACSGSIIGPNLILTSAHCFDIGNLNWAISYQNKLYDIAEIGIHQQYRREEVFDAYWNFLLEIRLHHDLALIKTKHPLTDETHSQTLNLAPNENDRAWFNVFIAGFGQTQHMFGIGEGEGTLRIAGPILLNQIIDQRITLNSGKISGCLGDSGGPLLSKENGRLMILGVLSQSDCQGKSTYQRVSQHSLAMEHFDWGPITKRQAVIIKE